MEEITLNGFEVFEDFLPGANVPKKKHSPLAMMITMKISQMVQVNQ